MGAGTALPSLVLFQHALTHSVPLTFVLADYNDAVLRLVTLPNFVLTWASTLHGEGANGLDVSPLTDGDLEISPALIDRFVSDLSSRNINLKFLSGPWSSSLASLIPASAPNMSLLVLAAETIYSPASTASFVDLLKILLSRVELAKAVLAAKRIYFGVGGSVDGLKDVCSAVGAIACEIEDHGVPGMDDGVGRALLEVRMR